MGKANYEITHGVEIEYGSTREVPFTDKTIEKFIEDARAEVCAGCPNEACGLKGEHDYINNEGLGDPTNTVVSFTCVDCVEPARIVEVAQKFTGLYDAAYDQAAVIQQQAESAGLRMAQPIDTDS